MNCVVHNSFVMNLSKDRREWQRGGTGVLTTEEVVQNFKH